MQNALKQRSRFCFSMANDVKVTSGCSCVKQHAIPQKISFLSAGVRGKLAFLYKP